MIMHVKKNFPPSKVLEKFHLNDSRKNTFDSSFDTINILRIVSVKELLFLQQQNVPRTERVIIE
jgi:hypothetical protein